MAEATPKHDCSMQDELTALYEGSADGILVADPSTKRILRANRAFRELLGYDEGELLGMSISELHPRERWHEVLEAFEAFVEKKITVACDIPLLRKDGSVVHVDVTAQHLTGDSRPILMGFFRDTTEKTRNNELLRASENRYRLIAENVGDVIWTASLQFPELQQAVAAGNAAGVVDYVLTRWRFSFISPAVKHVFGYTPEEAVQLSIHDFTTPASYAGIRENLIERFGQFPLPPDGQVRQFVHEYEFIAKDGSHRWCEVVTAYLCDERGMPTDMLGITRDISQRRQAERALRESESKLRSLFENLPDVVATIDRKGGIHFVNRGAPTIDRHILATMNGYELVAPEHRETCKRLVAAAFETGITQTYELQDIFGGWWSVRAARLAEEEDGNLALVICTDVTHQRRAAEAIHKEQRLLRQLLELHERERCLTAYEIHDGFSQQLTGALFRLQGFRERLAGKPESAWQDFDTAMRLITRAIDETRRLISGLRPPILDESGVIQAIEYLVYEHGRQNDVEIEFVHNVSFARLAPPLESAIFRIVQESLQNACRHSKSDRIRIELAQQDDRIRLKVRDWGVGFSPDAVEEQRFGLQGIRERVRLMNGRIVIDSAPQKGTLIAIDLPIVDIHRQDETALS